MCFKTFSNISDLKRNVSSENLKTYFATSESAVPLNSSAMFFKDLLTLSENSLALSFPIFSVKLSADLVINSSNSSNCVIFADSPMVKLIISL